MMDKSSKIFIAGHQGLVGSALVRRLKAAGFENLLLKTKAQLDLTEQQAVYDFFAKEQPEYVMIAAAKVGGIYANNTYPADFIKINLAIALNIIEAAHQHQVTRLLFLSSSCVYPRDCAQPMQESSLMTGLLEPTNRPYAIAKLAGIEMCWAYNRQYNTRFLVAMPAGLYGPNDNFSLQTSHIIPAQIRKFYEAVHHKLATIEAWGSGAAKREFMHVDDMADACLYLMQLPEHQFCKFINQDTPPLINIGSGSEISIKELVEMIQTITGFTGEVIWNTAKPDGMPRKLLDSHIMQQLGWYPKIPLADGLAQVYDYFATHYVELTASA